MIDAWLQARFPGPLADYLAATMAGIGELAESFPAGKQLLIWNMAQGRKSLSSRWGSRAPQFVFQNQIFPEGDATKPPEISRIVEQVLKTAADFPESQVSRHVILDIEDPNWNSVDATQLKVFPQNIRKRKDLILALREKLPGFLWGHWSDVPVPSINYCNYPDAEVRRWLDNAWREQEELLRMVDFVTPDFYVEPKPSPVANFDYCFTAAETAYAVRQTVMFAKSVRSDLPVIPGIMPERYKFWQVQPAPDTREQLLARRMPADYFRTIIEPCFAQADGVLLWLYQRIPADAAGPNVTWDWTAEWIGVLEEYLLNYGVLPWEQIAPQKGTA